MSEEWYRGHKAGKEVGENAGLLMGFWAGMLFGCVLQVGTLSLWYYVNVGGTPPWFQ